MKTNKHLIVYFYLILQSILTKINKSTSRFQTQFKTQFRTSSQFKVQQKNRNQFRKFRTLQRLTNREQQRSKQKSKLMNKQKEKQMYQNQMDDNQRLAKDDGQQQYNDDDRKLINILSNLPDGTENEYKDNPLATIRTVIKKNEHFQSMDDMHALDYEKLCDVRQGYALRYVQQKGQDSQQYQAQNGRKITVVTFEPVFLVLNKETLSYYMNENINSLIQSFPLADIETVPILPSQNIAKYQADHRMSCFLLHVNGMTAKPEALCLESDNSSKNWQDAIKTFYRCVFREAQSSENVTALTGGSIDVQSTMINQFAIMRAKNHQELQEKYDQGKNNLRQIIQIQNGKRNSFLLQAIEEYKKQIEEYKRLEEIQRLRIEAEQNKTEESIEQLDCINDKEQKDQTNSANTLIKEIISDVDSKELTLEQQLIAQLHEISEKTNTNINKIEEEREESQNMNTKIIQNFGIQEVQQMYGGQPQLCYDPDLGNDKSKQGYINQHCKKIVASKTSDIMKGNTMILLEKCMNEQGFCMFCCDYEVSMVNLNKKKDCMDKCSNALKNIMAPGIEYQILKKLLSD